MVINEKCKRNQTPYMKFIRTNERMNVCKSIKCWFQIENIDAVEDISEPTDSIRCVYGNHCFYSFSQSDNSIWNQKGKNNNNSRAKSGFNAFCSSDMNASRRYVVSFFSLSSRCCYVRLCVRVVDRQLEFNWLCREAVARILTNECDDERTLSRYIKFFVNKIPIKPNDKWIVERKSREKCVYFCLVFKLRERERDYCSQCWLVLTTVPFACDDDSMCALKMC